MFLLVASVLASARWAAAGAPAASAAGPESVDVEDAGPTPAPAVSPPAVSASPDAGTPPMSAEDGAPLGRAAAPTEAATRGQGAIRAGLEVFAQYSYRDVSGPGTNRTWFHTFDVPRAHVALEGELERARGRIVLEGTRSAAEGSLVGVSGDSLVLRIREAYGAYRIVAPLEISAGVIPTLTVPNLDGTWMMRAVAPSALEANGHMSPADLGAKARADLPRGYGWLAAAAYNGEGYTSRELNRGKSFEAAAEIHPLASIEAARPLGVFASYVAGSTGTFRARANRLTAGLLWQGVRVRGGALFTHAWGIAQLGTQRAIVATAFVRVEPIPRLLGGARLDHVIRNVEADSNDALTTIWGSVGYRVALPVEGFVALGRSIPTTRAQNELPGSSAWDARIIVRVVF